MGKAALLILAAAMTVQLSDTTDITSGWVRWIGAAQRSDENKQVHYLAEENNDHEVIKMLKQKVRILTQDISNLKDNDKAQESHINNVKDMIHESTKVWFSAVRDNGRRYFDEYVKTTDLVFNKTLINQGGGFNTRTGVFTCPVAGSYYISYFVQVGFKDGTNGSVNLLRNGASVTVSIIRDEDRYGNAKGVIANGFVLQLNHGDRLWLRSTSVVDSRIFWRGYGGYMSMFSGFLLK